MVNAERTARIQGGLRCSGVRPPPDRQRCEAWVDEVERRRPVIYLEECQVARLLRTIEWVCRPRRVGSSRRQFPGTHSWRLFVALVRCCCRRMAGT